MEKSVSKPKYYRILIIAGSILLTLMAIFHGSGIKIITNLMRESNSEEFIKEIFPILFLHPSIQLLGLVAFGLSTLYIPGKHKSTLIIISSLVIINSFAAFYLGALLPGILLLISSTCFFIAIFIKK